MTVGAAEAWIQTDPSSIDDAYRDLLEAQTEIELGWMPESDNDGSLAADSARQQLDANTANLTNVSSAAENVVYQHGDGPAVTVSDRQEAIRQCPWLAEQARINPAQTLQFIGSLASSQSVLATMRQNAKDTVAAEQNRASQNSHAGQTKPTEHNLEPRSVVPRPIEQLKVDGAALATAVANAQMADQARRQAVPIEVLNASLDQDTELPVLLPTPKQEKPIVRRLKIASNMAPEAPRNDTPSSANVDRPVINSQLDPIALFEQPGHTVFEHLPSAIQIDSAHSLKLESASISTPVDSTEVESPALPLLVEDTLPIVVDVKLGAGMENFEQSGTGQLPLSGQTAETIDTDYPASDTLAVPMALEMDIESDVTLTESVSTEQDGYRPSGAEVELVSCSLLAEHATQSDESDALDEADLTASVLVGAEVTEDSIMNEADADPSTNRLPFDQSLVWLTATLLADKSMPAALNATDNTDHVDESLGDKPLNQLYDRLSAVKVALSSIDWTEINDDDQKSRPKLDKVAEALLLLAHDMGYDHPEQVLNDYLAIHNIQDLAQLLVDANEQKELLAGSAVRALDSPIVDHTILSSLGRLVFGLLNRANLPATQAA